ELIEGEITQMTPIGSRHMACVMRFSSFLHRHLTPEDAVVSVQNPIRLDEFNEPEPDVALLQPRADFYENQHPGPADVLLIVEVSDTTLAYDRDVKGPLYARFGIPEFWIADVENKTVTVYRAPSPRGYEEMKTFRAGQTLSPLAFPELNMAVESIVG
ncbi:MAG TPA: Uma2 family endonuclease, partial [bacterium]|nr:Uma2 family endonuclease [bacterium]